MNKKFIQLIANKYFLFLIIIFLVLSGAIFLWQIFTAKEQQRLQVSIPENYQEKIVYAYQGQTFGITPLNAESSEVKKKFLAAEYDYQDPYTQVDVKRLVTENGVKEDIILREPGHPLQFQFQLDLGEFDYEKDLTGNITLTAKADKLADKDLQKKFYLPAPYFIDANGKKSDTSAIDLRIDEKGIITYTLDEHWLSQAQYPVVLDPSVELVILNVHSYPQTGDEWVVDFTTKGKADLKIIPADQATIDDDRFVGLFCDGEERLPEIYKNDVIFYANWECSGVGRVVHFTEYAGKHTLKFEFADAVAYAYNSDWWNPSWTKRRKIFFDTTTSATTSNLTDFPISVQLNSSRVDYSATQNSGQDIRFVDTDGTELPYEIESWNESGTSTLWVKVPQVNQNTTADYIWMYYGNPSAADNSTTTGVWNSGYKMVLHMNETSGWHYDSTANGQNATSVAVTTQGSATGIANGADYFDGSLDQVIVPRSSEIEPATNLTVSAWVKTDSAPNYDEIFRKQMASGSGFDLRYQASGGLFWYAKISGTWRSVTNNYASSSGVWHHLVGTYDGTTLLLFANSVPSAPGSYTGSISYDASDLLIGSARSYDSGYDLTGYLDELRLSNVTRDANWISFEYCNMMDTCNTYGTEETDVWWDTKWLKRKKIMFDTTTSATTTSLVDFPVAVQLNSSRIDYAYTKPNGEDIRFIDSDGKTPLSYEIEKWDKTATSTFWVKVPTIDRNSNSDHIWLYYNNVNALDNSTTTGVWTNGFVGVWHMNNAYNASTTDSTKNALHGISRNLAATSTYMVGSALEFNGSTADVKLPVSTLLNPEYTLTVEAWARTNTLSGEQSIFGRTLSYELLATRTWAPTGRPLAPIYYAYDTTFELESATALTPGQFTYLVATYNGTTTGKAILYQDTLVKHTIATTTPEGLYQNSANAYIGDSQWDDDSGFNGVLDEIRISDIDRSQSWINFTYCNIKDTCNTYGKEQTYGWWDTRWQKRKPIYFDTTTSATTSDLANFTALVRLNSSRINYEYTQNNGEDIRFVDADGLTVLPYEIEKWNESGESLVWVKVPKIDKNSKTDHIWMYYDNPTATDNSTTTGAWDNNFILVHHLQETDIDGGEGDIRDSSLFQNHGTTTNMTTTDQVTGKVDGSMSFGTSSYINVPSDTELELGNAGTVEAWVKFDEFIDEKGVVAKAIGTAWLDVDYGIVYRGSWLAEKLAGVITNDDSGSYQSLATNNLSVGVWYRVVFTWDGTNLRIFNNGNQDNYTSQTVNVRNTSNPIRIGTWGSTARSFPGDIDEVRVSNIARDPQWIKFSYCNMNDSCTSFGAEEAQAIKIYRSMGFNNTSPLASGSSTVELTISGFDATFSAGMPMNVGVGDAIQYDSDNNGSVDSIVFIHKRVSSTQYEIRTANGTSTPNAVTADKDWRIYRAYSTLSGPFYASENTGIASNVRNFDTWSNGVDLVTNNYQWNIAMYADSVATTTGFIISDSWITSRKNYLRIYTPYEPSEVGVSQRHRGVMTDRAFKILHETTGNYQRTFNIDAEYVWIDGLQFELWNRNNYSTTYSLYPFVKVGWISNNIFKGDSTDPDVDYGAMKYTETYAEFYIWNNIFYDYYSPTSTYGQNAIEINTTTSRGVIVNNTCYRVSDNCYGWRLINYKVMNNIAQATGDGFASLGGFSSTTDYNISNVTSDSPGSHSKNNVTVSFRDINNRDFHLAPTDSVARDSGVDFSIYGDIAFYNDIDNQSRTNGPWDIGADEYVVTSLGTEGWWQSAWKNRMKIIIDNSSQSETLIDFPLAVILSPSRIDYTKTQDNGEDIRFVASDGTELPYEIEKWDEAATSTVWVKVPQILGGSNTGYIWMYYGNPDAPDNQSPNDVWDMNYKFVHHLEESPNDGVAGHFDSTSNNATGTPYNFQTGGSGTTNATGKLDGADYFDITTNNDFVSIPSLASQQLTASGTLEVWTKPDNTTGRLVTHGQQNSFWLGYVSSRFNVTLYNGALNSASTTYTGNNENWYYVVGTFGYDGPTKYLRLYVNGLLQDSVALSANNINYDSGDYQSCINGYGDCSGGFGKHTIDEVRLSSVTRSADWIKFSYCNMNDSCLDYSQTETFGDSSASAGGASKVKGGVKIKGGIRFK